jgi:membrane protein
LIANAERLLSWSWRAIVNFNRHNCLDHCATVAFYSLLSLGPLAYLVGGTLSLFYAEGDALKMMLDRLSPFLPEAVESALRRLAPGMRTSGSLVVLALPALIWVASTALSALEYAVNVCFDIPMAQRKRWYSHIRALSLLGIGWLFLSLALLANTILLELVRYIDLLPLPTVPARMVASASYLALLAASFLIFGLFYKWLPRTSIRWRAAGSGALLAVALWEGARRLFGGLLMRSPAYGLLTGALAGTVTFLLWIYTAVAIVLLGAEFAALVHRELRAGSGKPPSA